MRVLVIGGAGYIGSHMLKRLAQAGCEAVTLDDLSTGWRRARLTIWATATAFRSAK